MYPLNNLLNRTSRLSGMNINATSLLIDQLCNIHFDGKNTLIRSSAGGNTHGEEDHYSVVLHFPHNKKLGEYVGFYKPEDGKD